MRQRDRKERKEREAKRLKCKSDFRAILMEDPNIKVTSQWRKVKETLENNEVYRSMDKMDALDAFQVRGVLPPLHILSPAQCLSSCLSGPHPIPGAEGEGAEGEGEGGAKAGGKA